MPGFDGTGPRGMGAMTGGGRGYCALPVRQRFVGRGLARGMGRPLGLFGRGGRGMGRGAFSGNQSWGYAGGMPAGAPASSQQELSDLRQQAQLMQSELEHIQQRISELDQ